MEYVRPSIAAMKGYVPGIQPDPGQKYIKLNSNENPYPPSPRVREVLQRLNYDDLRIYPDPMSLELREKLGRLHGFPNLSIHRHCLLCDQTLVFCVRLRRHG